MSKKSVVMVLFVVLALSFTVLAASDDCTFFCKVNKFLWGDAALRENVAGKAV